ncbi:hypothetical protein LLEC1_04347 [Akanthomyces lecanii]|uniref:DUF7029 domain-containing protein n=1 Tax=Cordyceps confragosa TaxID=2714763 RepID=A0A179I2H8_CORDF|nr:hypothetical protein LLEC1_04347 [Akanthomyces lecanii]
MLFDNILTLLWAAAFVAAFPFFSLPKWQSSRRNVGAIPVERETAQVAPSPAPSQGGFCGWVPVEVPVDEESRQQTGQQSKDQKHDQASAPSQTLAPSVPRSWDTSSLKNVEPVAPKEDSQMHYGVSEPAEEGYYAFLTYRFTLRSINLDHSSHVSVEYTSNSNLVIKFKTSESFERATGSWDTGDDLLLIATAKGCPGPSAGDRCFYRATDLIVDHEKQTIVAKGAPEHPENVLDSAETEWGLWAPHNTTGGNFTRPAGSSFNYTADTSGKGPSDAPRDSHGLATASLGPSFDSTLDGVLGYHELPSDSEAFLDRIIADGEAISSGHDATRDGCVESASGGLRRRRRLQARGLWSDLWDDLVDAVKPVYNTVADGLTIQGDFNEPVSWDLPGPSVSGETSPWSDNSIALLKQQSASESGELREHVNIYCVDCGVSGQAVFSGKAKLTPLKGIFDGELALRTNMKMVLKVGVDAQVTFNTTIKKNLFTVGLPGLSYGIVTVGPYISVAAKVGLDAAANGKLLVGGEMGLTQASAPSKSTAVGWTPYFKPVLEAEGDVMLAASAALPIGIKAGLKIASFEIALGVVEEPAIIAAATIAGSASYDKANGFHGGITEVDGCAGIRTSLNWSNKLSLDIFGASSKVLHDTGVQPIVKGCLNSPTLTSSPTAFLTSFSKNSKTSSPTTSANSSHTSSSFSSLISPSPTSTNSSHTSSSFSSLISPSPTSTNSSYGWSNGSSTVSLPVSSPTSLATSSLTSSSISSSYGWSESSSTSLPVSLPVSSPTGLATSSITSSSISSPTSSQKSASSSSVTSSVTGSATGVPSPSVESSHPKTNSPCDGVDETSSQVFRNGHKFDLAPLLTTAGTSMVASCNDGNIYVAAASNETNKKCNSAWPTSKEGIIPFDGSLNVMHYYASTMKAVGVSRLRSSPAHKIPNDAVVTVLVPAPAADGSLFYMAADASAQVFYPVVCDFAGGAVPRVFLAKDMSAGIRMLEGGSVAESITGAKVEKCFGLSLSPQF